MRAYASMPLLVLVGCVTPAAPPAPAPVAATTQLAKVDYAGAFGGRSSGSLYDPRLSTPTMMARVLLEPSTLSDDDAKKGMESWTRRKLVQRLGQRGSVVIAPPPPACPRDTCYAAQPTAALRNLRLAAGRDDVKVKVTRHEDGVYWVSLHRNLQDASLCPKDFGLRLGFVQLLGQLQTLPEGAIAALFQELAILGPPPKSVLELELPAPEEDPEGFCARIREAFEATPDFAVDDARFEDATQAVLEVGLHPLYPKRASDEE